MKRLALLAALLVCVPFVQGMPTDEEFVVLAGDGAGDVANPGGVPLAAPVADLVELGVAETEERLWFRLRVDDLEPDNDGPSGNVDFHILFASEQQAYRVLVDRNVPLATGVPVYAVHLYAHEEATGDERELDADVSLDVQPKRGAILIGLGWTSIPDEQGLRLLPGKTLQGVHAFTRSGNNLDGAMAVVPGAPTSGVLDRVPDNGEVIHVIRTLGAQEGSIIGASQNPLRASNGAASTFLFPLSISNIGSEQVVVDVVPRALPAGWSAEPLATPLVVDPSSTTTSAIVVATTARHQHGGQDIFFADVMWQGEVASTVQLEVHYTAIAQPSGHHPQLQFFSRLARTGSALDPVLDAYAQATGYHFNRAYMTTDVDAAGDDEVPVTSSSVDGRERWRIALAPSLGLGLDFSDQAGAISMPLQPSRDSPIESLALEGELAVEAGDERQVLATGATSVDRLEGLMTVELPLAVEEGIDVVPFRRGQNLVLTVYTTYTDPFGIGVTPNLHPGGSITLPLEEYKDPIPEGSLSSINLVAVEDYREVNPGKRTIFELVLSGTAEGPVALEVLGLPAGWASQFSRQSPKIDGSPVKLQITAPMDAAHGDTAVFFVRAAPRDGAPTAVGLQVYVVTSEAVSEPPALEVDRVESPLSPIILLVGLLAALGRGQRLRR